MKRRATFDPSIFETRPGSGAEWLTLLALAFYHNLENGAWPAMRTLSGMTGLDKSTVSRAVQSLQNKDIVRLEFRRGKRLYRLPVDHHNRILGGPERWRYQDQKVADSQQEVAVSQVHGADSQQQGCEMTTPSETRPPASNLHKGTSYMNKRNPAAGGYRPPQSYEEEIERNG